MIEFRLEIAREDIIGEVKPHFVFGSSVHVWIVHCNSNPRFETARCLNCGIDRFDLEVRCYSHLKTYSQTEFVVRVKELFPWMEGELKG